MDKDRNVVIQSIILLICCSTYTRTNLLIVTWMMTSKGRRIERSVHRYLHELLHVFDRYIISYLMVKLLLQAWTMRICERHIVVCGVGQEQPPLGKMDKTNRWHCLDWLSWGELYWGKKSVALAHMTVDTLLVGPICECIVIIPQLYYVGPVQFERYLMELLTSAWPWILLGDYCNYYDIDWRTLDWR